MAMYNRAISAFDLSITSHSLLKLQKNVHPVWWKIIWLNIPFSANFLFVYQPLLLYKVDCLFYFDYLL